MHAAKRRTRTRATRHSGQGMTRRPVPWEVEWFARLGRRITSVVDYDDGLGTRYTSEEDPQLKRILIDDAERERLERQGRLW